MKNKLFQRLTSALCVLVLLLGLAPTAFAADKPAESCNRNKQNYTTYYASTVTSYLYANTSGGLTRVELVGDKIVVENYDSSFNMLNIQRITKELPIWGGFFAGENANYVITGQTNDAQDNTCEVVRVTKYDKNWNRVGHASIRSGDFHNDVTIPFKAGSLRCAEYGGYLYIYTCAQGYADKNGTRHQGADMYKLQENSMTFVDEGMKDTVSHSFNQYILIDQDRSIVTLDQGDANYRGAILMRYWTKAGPESITWYDRGPLSIVHDNSFIQEFPGKSGENKTGAGLGGLAETSSGYVTAYAYDPNWGNSASRNIYLGYTSKSTMQSTTKKLTVQAGASTPVLAPTGLSGGYVLWNVIHEANVPTDTICYAPYSADGTVGAVQTVKGALSDCQPIYWNGKAVWYVTNYSAPVFYTLDSSGLHSYPANGGEASSTPASPSTPSSPSGPSSFTDVPASHWARSAIDACVANGAVTGYGNGKFGPGDTVTSVQFIAMLTRAFYADRLKDYTAAPGQPWYTPNITLADELGITENLSSLTDKPMTRYDMAQALDNIVSAEHLVSKALLLAAARMNKGFSWYELSTTATTSLKDWSSIPSGYQIAVSDCYALGVLTGMEDGTFSGDKTMTRAQACAVITRMMDLFNNELPSTFYGS